MLSPWGDDGWDAKPGSYMDVIQQKAGRMRVKSVKEITKLEKTSLSDFNLHTEERKCSVLFIDCLCLLKRHCRLN